MFKSQLNCSNNRINKHKQFRNNYLCTSGWYQIPPYLVQSGIIYVWRISNEINSYHNNKLIKKYLYLVTMLGLNELKKSFNGSCKNCVQTSWEAKNSINLSLLINCYITCESNIADGKQQRQNYRKDFGLVMWGERGKWEDVDHRDLAVENETRGSGWPSY